MVKVFKTDVQNAGWADYIINDLVKAYPHLMINFDLEDCDHILRVEGAEFSAADIITRLKKLGYRCEELL